jgi:pimeloyl-ACP methyl ester carboxylesterase
VPGRAARAAAVGAVVAGGAALGFLAERSIVRGRFAPRLPPEDSPLGEFAGETHAIRAPDGSRIVVETYGPVGAPTLVLAHGWICTGRVWHEQVVRLVDRYRIVTYDQPGHGRSDSPTSGEYDIDLLGDVLETVVRTCTAPGPVTVVGHSMGAMGVMNAARRFPETFTSRLNGVALISTTSSAKAERISLEVGIRAAARLERGIRRLVPTLRDPRLLDATDRLTSATSDLSYLAARWTSVGPGADPRAVAFTQQLALSSGSDVVLGLVESVLGVDEDAGLEALVDVPTVIVVGTHDRLTPVVLSHRMAERLGGRVVELEGRGHMCLLEAGQEITEVIEQLLEQRVPEDAGGEQVTPTGASA